MKMSNLYKEVTSHDYQGIYFNCLMVKLNDLEKEYIINNLVPKVLEIRLVTTGGVYEYIVELFYKKHIFKIYFHKTSDDWFYFSYTFKLESIGLVTSGVQGKYYKCDQLDGLVEAINYIIRYEFFE